MSNSKTQEYYNRILQNTRWNIKSESQRAFYNMSIYADDLEKDLIKAKESIQKYKTLFEMSKKELEKIMN
jgi:hypothetical protein